MSIVLQIVEDPDLYFMVQNIVIVNADQTYFFYKICYHGQILENDVRNKMVEWKKIFFITHNIHYNDKTVLNYTKYLIHDSKSGISL